MCGLLRCSRIFAVNAIFLFPISVHQSPLLLFVKLQESQSIEDKFCLTIAVIQGQEEKLVSKALALQNGWKVFDQTVVDLGNSDLAPFQGYDSPKNVVDAVDKLDILGRGASGASQPP